MPFFKTASKTVLLGLGLAKLGLAQYSIADDYSDPSTFFSQFTFFTDSDPTHGFVTYVDQSTAQSDGLISTTSDTVTMGVDHTNVQTSGRPSVRITSNTVYNHALVVLDAAHMPGGICGTWPAFWMVGPNWPNDGEIDIVEGVNDQTENDMTLHTGAGCSITNDGDFTGSIIFSDCDSSGSSNDGCQIQDSRTSSYGSAFNSANGGVYAMEWTSSDINVWFWTRGSAPSDVSGSSPDPSGWGEPVAQFQGDCTIDSSFKDLQIVFDTTFCGDWAGNSWTGSCASLADTCTDYVGQNPSAFADAYWTINSLKVYTDSSADENGKVISRVKSGSGNQTVTDAPSLNLPNHGTSAGGIVGGKKRHLAGQRRRRGAHW
ncbi:MAG: hypothetical protein M1819_002886 [Sarea resinae]|nr:MAG: hypothetical protein M1819_002886 [Sarea resinae]